MLKVRNFFRALVIATILVVSAAGFSGILAGDPVSADAGVQAIYSLQDQAVQPATGSLTQLYQDVSPSVVAISVTTGRSGSILGRGTGSGFVIDNEGHIITNNHVVDGANFIEIEFFDGTLAQAQIVGLDPDSDIAVLSVDVSADKLHPVTFGDSGVLIVGDSVVAIGSPYGQNWTLTTGIVSGLNRVIRGLADFSIGGVIQTDAAINPGNSGGPLLNLNGQVIGVNSQILSQSGSNSGVGFAVPINLVQRVAQDLIETGHVDYSYLGISGGDVNLELIQSLGLPENTRGVLVSQTTENSPAAEAGLQNSSLPARAVNSNAAVQADVITAIDGLRIKGMDDLIAYLANETSPGQMVTLTVLRNSEQTLQLPVTLTSRPSSR